MGHPPVAVVDVWATRPNVLMWRQNNDAFRLNVLRPTMKKYENVTLEKQAFQMEECYFLNCVLKDCDLFYSGGTVMVINLRTENCRWQWQNEAANTVNLLRGMGIMKDQQVSQTMTTPGTGIN